MPGQQPGQRGEHGTVGPAWPRPGDLAPQHRDLVPQHQDIRVLGGITGTHKHLQATVWAVLSRGA